MKGLLARLTPEDFRTLEQIHRDLWWKNADFSALQPGQQWCKVFIEFLARREAREAKSKS